MWSSWEEWIVAWTLNMKPSDILSRTEYELLECGYVSSVVPGLFWPVCVKWPPRKWILWCRRLVVVTSPVTLKLLFSVSKTPCKLRTASKSSTVMSWTEIWNHARTFYMQSYISLCNKNTHIHTDSHTWVWAHKHNKTFKSANNKWPFRNWML